MSTGVLFWDVDTQYDFMDPEGALYVPGAEAIEGRLARLTRFAEARRIPLVATADDHRMSDVELAATDGVLGELARSASAAVS